MHAEECVEFIKFTTSTPEQTLAPSDERVLVFFSNYDPDADGRIVLEDFLGFYREKALGRPEVVWNNLAHAKIGNDLRPLTEPSSPEDLQEQKDMNVLPRCKLTKEGTFYDDVITVLKSLPSVA